MLLRHKDLSESTDFFLCRFFRTGWDFRVSTSGFLQMRSTPAARLHTGFSVGRFPLAFFRRGITSRSAQRWHLNEFVGGRLMFSGKTHFPRFHLRIVILAALMAV